MTHSPRAVLIALVAVSMLVRFGAALLVRTPLYFPDEYLYAALARGFAHGHFAEVRGHHVTTSSTVSYVMPFLTAPLWLVHDVDVSYRLTQLLGSAVFSCAAFPAYALARRAGVGAQSGLLVAGLSLAIPAGLFTGMVMAEPYAYPAFLLAVLLAVETVRRRTSASVLWTTTAAVALIVIGGLQFALFLPAALAAALVVVPARRRLATVSGLLLFAGASAVSVRYADQGVVAEVVSKARLLHQPLGQTATWLGINAFLLAVAAGWVTAPGAVLGLVDLTRSARQEERFLGLFSVLLLAGLLFEAATWSATFDRTYERFAFYGIPLVLIGFVRWAERAVRDRARFAVLGYACAASAALVPLAAGMHVDNPYAPPLTGLSFSDPASTALVWAPLLAIAAAAAALVGYRHPRRLAAVAAVVCLSSTAVAAAAVIRFAHSLPDTRVGASRDAVYVTTSHEDPFAEMRSLFWNPNLDQVAVFGGGGAPDGFGASNVELRANGSLTTTAGSPVAGPFVASPALLALPSSSAAPLSRFSAPVDVLAFGWYSTDDYLAPYARLVIAGRARGSNVRLRLWSSSGLKKIYLACPGRVQRLTIGRRSLTVRIHVPPDVVRTCEVRLIGGTVDVVRGRNVGVRGALSLRPAG